MIAFSYCCGWHHTAVDWPLLNQCEKLTLDYIQNVFYSQMKPSPIGTMWNSWDISGRQSIRLITFFSSLILITSKHDWISRYATIYLLYPIGTLLFHLLLLLSYWNVTLLAALLLCCSPTTRFLSYNFHFHLHIFKIVITCIKCHIYLHQVKVFRRSIDC